MVGGHARGLADERLYRFEFPERPGALLKFLQAIGTAWNISLFHYRNHGSDYGRVLAGIQVPRKRAPTFCCISTNCTTPTPKRPTIRRTRFFSELRRGADRPVSWRRRSCEVLAVSASGRTVLSQVCARRTKAIVGASGLEQHRQCRLRVRRRLHAACPDAPARRREWREPALSAGPEAAEVASQIRDGLVAHRQRFVAALPRSTSNRAKCISAAARYW